MTQGIRDPEVLAFIARTRAASLQASAPPRPSGPAAARRVYERMAETFHGGRPPGIGVEDGAFRGPACHLAVRRYWPGDPGPARVLYFHGGGFALGSLDSHDSICADIAATCRTEVVSAAYRLSPENPHPAAYEDAVAAVEAFDDRPLILAGDSAGGNLAAAAALVGGGRLLGQVLIYPDLGGIERALPAYTERAEAPLLTTDDVLRYRRQRAGGMLPEDDPTFDPLAAPDLSGAPPCFVSAAEHDPLRDDGPAYVLRLTEASVPAEAVVEPDLPHGHLRARRTSRAAASAFERICAAISRFAAAAD